MNISEQIPPIVAVCWSGEIDNEGADEKIIEAIEALFGRAKSARATNVQRPEGGYDMVLVVSYRQEEK